MNAELMKIIDQLDLEQAWADRQRRELEKRVLAFMTEMHSIAVNNVYRYRHESVWPPEPMRWFGMQFWPNHQNFEDFRNPEHILTTLTEEQATVLIFSVFEGKIQGTIKQPRLILDYRFDFRGDGWVVLETKGFK